MFCNFIDTPEIDVTPSATPAPVVTEEAPPVEEEEASPAVEAETPPEGSEEEETAEESKIYSQYARVGRVGRGSTLKNVTIVSNVLCAKPSSRNASDENYFCGELAQGENSVSFLGNCMRTILIESIYFRRIITEPAYFATEGFREF